MFGKSILVAGMTALILTPAAALAHEGRGEGPRRDRDERVVVVTGGSNHGGRDGGYNGNRGGRDCDDRREYRPAPPRGCDRPVSIVRDEPRHHGHWGHHRRPRFESCRPGFVVIGRIGF